MARGHTQQFLTALAERQRLVSSADALEIGRDMGLSEGGVRVALHRLESDAWLKRIRRGLYIVTVPGLPPLHPFVIGSAVADGAISGWAALHHHHLTEQIPRVTEVTTTKRLQGLTVVDGRQLVAFEGERFEVTTVVTSRFFGVEEQWFDNNRARVFDRERAVLDLFIRPRHFGGIETALEMFEEHGSELDRAKLVKHAIKLGTASVAKRVGWVLEETGAQADLLEPLLAIPATGYSLLDPSRSAHGPQRARWHLRENLGPTR